MTKQENKILKQWEQLEAELQETAHLDTPEKAIALSKKKIELKEKVQQLKNKYGL